MLQKIEIVIPVLKTKKSDLNRLLSSILNQSPLNYSNINILVVLNPAYAAEALQFESNLKSVLKFPDFISLTVFPSESRGVNAARQLGLQHCTSEIVFFFDDDVVLNDSTLTANHVEQHLKNTGLFAIGGSYHNDEIKTQFALVYLRRQIRWINEAYTDSSRTGVAYLLGGHFSIKRSLLQTANLGFDKSILFGSSETEFFMSARSKGLKLQLFKFSVQHHIIDGSLRLMQKTFLQGRGKRYIESKNLLFQPIYKSIVINCSVFESVVERIFEFCFFLGYYSFDGNYSGFFKMHFQKINLAFKHQKQKVINSIRSGL